MGVSRRMAHSRPTLWPLLVAVMILALLGHCAPALADDLLTPEERAYLDRSKQLRLVYDWKFPPFEFQGDDGALSGLASDIIKEVEARLGVRITIQAERDWPGLLNKLKNREADLAPAMAFTAERAQYLLFTDPYIHLPTVVFTQKSFRNITSLGDLRGLRVGVVKDYVAHTFLKNNYKDVFTIVPVNNIQQGLHDTAFGVLDGFVENVGVASYYIEQEGLRNLRVAAETEHETALSIAVRSDMPLVHSAMQKALNSIPQERKRAMVAKWVHTPSREVRTLTWALYGTIGLLSVAVLLLGVLLLRGRRLRKDLQAKARELAVELERGVAFQQALQKNEMYLRSILSNSEAIIFQVGPEGALLYAGGRGLARADLEDWALAGGSVFDLFADDLDMRTTLRNALAGLREQFTVRLRGEYFQGACSPVFDPQGKVQCVIIVATNVTELETVRRTLHANEDRLRLALEATSDGLWDWAAASGECYFSPRWYTMLGYEPDELPGNIASWESLLHPSERASIVAAQRQALTKGEDYTHEYRMRAKDGTYRWILARWKVVERDAQGGPLRVVGVNADITARKEAEDRYRAIFANAPIGIFRNSYDGRPLEANPALARMLGQALGDDGSVPVLEIASEVYADPTDRERMLEALAVSPQGVSLEVQLRRRDGGVFPALVHASLHFDDEGRPLFVDGTVENITERKQAEEETERWQRKFDALSSAAQHVLYEYDLVNDMVTWSASLHDVLGYTLEELQGSVDLWAECIHPEDRATTLAVLDEARRNCSSFQLDYRFLHKNGLFVYISERGICIADKAGTPVQMFGMMQDVTASKALEEALRASEEKYRAIFNNAPIGIFRTSFDGLIGEVNTALARMHGFATKEEMLSSVRDLAFDAYPHPEDRQKLLRALLAAPHGAQVELLLKRVDGVNFPAIINASLQHNAFGEPTYIDGTIEDITERKRAEAALRDSEARYRSVIENIQDMFYRTDTEGNLVMFSPSTALLLGYSLDDPLLGAPVTNFWMRPEAREELLERLASQGMVQDYEVTLRTKAGEPMLVSTTSAYYRDADGKVLGVEGIFRDIAERKRLELRLADQLAFQQALLDTIPYAVFYKGADSRFVGFNKAYEECFGVRREDLIGKRVLDMEYLPEADRLAYQAEDEDVIAHVGRVHKEMPIPFADGQMHQTLYSVTGFRLADGSSGGLIGIIVDITERKRGEEALRASEARFRAFMEFLPDYVVIKDAESRPVYVNQRFLDTFVTDGRMGKLPREVFDPTTAARVEEMDTRALREGFVVYDEEWPDKAGARRLLEIRKFRIERESGSPLVGTILTDITQRRYNEEKYRVLFETSSEGILVLKDLRIVDCNPQALVMFACQREDLVGHTPGEFSPPVQPGGEESSALAERLLLRAQGGEPQAFEWLYLRCDGTAFTAEVILTVMDLFSETFLVGFMRDISDRKQMQELMIQTEKMMSVGGLAAGMAHELNNPLGIILQSVQNMERRFLPSLPGNAAVAANLGLDLSSVAEYLRARGIDEYMQGIQEAGERAAKIIRTMLDFSRGSQSVRASCSVPAMIDTALGLAANDYDLKKMYDFKSILIERQDDGAVGDVECTETEIIQVLLNIIKNSAQAMPGRGQRADTPRLRLTTSRTPEAVRIEIEDNGPGMDEATRRRVFEPFFTTKPQGEGTGLGLSVGYFIITQKHRGHFSVESQPGVGTRFVIELPLV